MENRKPFQLKNTLIVYNFLQVVFSSWLFYEVSLDLCYILNLYLIPKKCIFTQTHNCLPNTPSNTTFLWTIVIFFRSTTFTHNKDFNKHNELTLLHKYPENVTLDTEKPALPYFFVCVSLYLPYRSRLRHLPICDQCQCMSDYVLKKLKFLLKKVSLNYNR